MDNQNSSNQSNILIVDDNTENLKILTLILSKKEYLLRTALSGPLALEAVRNSLPDLIILDIMMPGMDGFEVCKKLKEEETCHDIPIIFIDDRGESKVKIEAFNVGGVDYINKPFHEEEVIARVKTHIKLRNTQKQLEEKYAHLEQEIIERKMYESFLLEAEKKFRLITDNIEDVFWISSPGLNEIIYISPAYEKLWGRSKEKLYKFPKSFIEAIYPDDQEKIFAEIEKHKNGSWEIDYRIIKPDGAVLWIHDQGFPIYDENNNLSLMLCVARDITKAKQMETVLEDYQRHLEGLVEKRTIKLTQAVDQLQWEIAKRKKTEKTLRIKDSAVNSSVNAIAFSDLDSNITYVNPAFVELWKFDNESEILGHSFFDLWKNKDQAQKLIITLRDKGAWIGELKAKRKHAATFDVEISANIVTDEVGDSICMMASFRDISDRKRVQQLQQDVERIFRHDIKNPLNGIIGFSELLLLSKSLNAEQTENLSYIYKSSQQMLHMINQSMDIFKMESGSYQLGAKEIDIVSIFKEIHNELIQLQHHKKNKIVYKFKNNVLSSDKSYVIKGERLHLKSLFSNLIRNALEASPENNQVTISIHHDEDFHIFDIHNWGLIPSDIQDNFFEKYTTSGKKEGTGLGTYSALLVAKAHCGNISFKTSEKDGTHIIVNLSRQLKK